MAAGQSFESTQSGTSPTSDVGVTRELQRTSAQNRGAETGGKKKKKNEGVSKMFNLNAILETADKFRQKLAELMVSMTREGWNIRGVEGGSMFVVIGTGIGLGLSPEEEYAC